MILINKKIVGLLIASSISFATAKSLDIKNENTSTFSILESGYNKIVKATDGFIDSLINKSKVYKKESEDLSKKSSNIRELVKNIADISKDISDAMSKFTSI